MNDVRTWDLRSGLNYRLKQGRLERPPFHGVRVLGCPLPVFGRQAGYMLSELLDRVREISSEEPFP